MYRKLLAGLLLGGCLVVAPVRAQDSIEAFYVQQEMRQMEVIGSWLNLTATQKNQVKEIIGKTLARIQALPRPDPRPLLDQPTFNRVMAGNLVDQRRGWQRNIDIAIMEAFHQAYQLLNETQKGKFQEAIMWHGGALPHNEQEANQLPFMKRSGG